MTVLMSSGKIWKDSFRKRKHKSLNNTWARIGIPAYSRVGSIAIVPKPFYENEMLNYQM